MLASFETKERRVEVVIKPPYTDLVEIGCKIDVEMRKIVEKHGLGCLRIVMVDNNGNPHFEFRGLATYAPGSRDKYGYQGTITYKGKKIAEVKRDRVVVFVGELIPENPSIADVWNSIVEAIRLAKMFRKYLVELRVYGESGTLRLGIGLSPARFGHQPSPLVNLGAQFIDVEEPTIW